MTLSGHMPIINFNYLFKLIHLILETLAFSMLVSTCLLQMGYELHISLVESSLLGLHPLHFLVALELLQVDDEFRL